MLAFTCRPASKGTHILSSSPKPSMMGQAFHILQTTFPLPLYFPELSVPHLTSSWFCVPILSSLRMPRVKSTILIPPTKSLFPWDGNAYINGAIVCAQK